MSLEPHRKQKQNFIRTLSHSEMRLSDHVLYAQTAYISILSS